MGFSADGPELDEQPAITRATQAASATMRVGRALRDRRPPSPVLSPCFARDTLIVGITALAPGLEYRADERYQLGRRRRRRRNVSPSRPPAQRLVTYARSFVELCTARKGSSDR